MFHLNLSGRSLAFKLVGPADPYYDQAVRLAQHVYQQCYSARIAPRPHRFVVCIDVGKSQALACAGLTFAGNGTLFSEQYLEQPLTQILADIFQREVARRDVAEVSALATLEPSIGTELMRAMALICWYLGLRGVLCTATTKLRRSFQYMKLPFQEVAVADVNRLDKVAGVDWGTYYDTRPVTGLVRLDALGSFFDTVSCRYNQQLLEMEAPEELEDMGSIARGLPHLVAARQRSGVAL
ncbi:thermostable hemolysin [Massilia sp. NR 4-1]|uniref:thermostable hemolysin n=1 Tax=Massilia sp. NR 4-1 TaxID=1678028 RepID=UPI00067D35D8|nr:thermostable hemolysin [Massilia sp. NR 4-1]AKU24349.1 hypothetical protein ACZ75_25700 [Massilia sp. NR 4-1]